MQQLKIISAGACSGKTYRLTKEMTKMLQPSATGKAAVRASGIIATTFTNKAAAELKERVRIELLESGLTKEADELASVLGLGLRVGLGLRLGLALGLGLGLGLLGLGLNPNANPNPNPNLFHVALGLLAAAFPTLTLTLPLTL